MRGLGRDETGAAGDTLAAELVREYAECAYICGDFDAAEKYSQLLYDHSETDLERARICHMQAIQYATAQELEQAFDAASRGLSLLGEQLEREPSDERIGAETRKRR